MTLCTSQLPQTVFPPSNVTIVSSLSVLSWLWLCYSIHIYRHFSIWNATPGTQSSMDAQTHKRWSVSLVSEQTSGPDCSSRVWHFAEWIKKGLNVKEMSKNLWTCAAAQQGPKGQLSKCWWPENALCTWSETHRNHGQPISLIPCCC